VIAAALVGCVTQQHDDVTRARAAYDRCVADSSAAHPDCVALHERLLAAQRRYAEDSRRAWACDPAQEQCPTPR